ncbi:MAG: DUF4421 family protein [Bdellovibrionota bacterium]
MREIFRIFLPFSVFFSVFVSAFFFSNPALSQSAEGVLAELETSKQEASEDIGKTDAQFVAFNKNHLLVTYLDFSFYSFYLGAPDINGSSYLPNYAPKIGIQYGYRGIMMKFTVPLGSPSDEIDRRGPSKESGYILSRHWRSLGVDLYYQSYKGLYAHKPMADFSNDRPRRFPQLPDAHVLNFGVNVYHVLSPDSYSLQAAFSQTELQTASGGSWLLNAFYNHVQLSTGNIFLPGTDPTAPTAPPDIHSGIFDTLGAGGGFGYAYIDGKIFAVAQGVLGLGIQYQRVAQNSDGPSEQLSPAINLSANVSAGVNEGTYLWGIRGFWYSLSSRVRDVQIASNTVSGQIFLGGRF